MATITYYPDSSNLSCVTWFSEGQGRGLGVTFKSGAVYLSKAEIFPKALFLEWIAAESAGRFFHERIKSVYELEKVQEETNVNTANNNQ